MAMLGANIEELWKDKCKTAEKDMCVLFLSSFFILDLCFVKQKKTGMKQDRLLRVLEDCNNNVEGFSFPNIYCGGKGMLHSQ